MISRRRNEWLEKLPVLSVEQSRELKKLQIFPEGTNSFLWRKALTDWNMKDISEETEYILSPNASGFSPIVMGFEQFDEIPTYLDSELFKVLPKEITYGGNNWTLRLEGNKDSYIIEYYDTPLGQPLISKTGKSLGDVCFQVIKELVNHNIKLNIG
jgi:hypothetical protein